MNNDQMTALIIAFIILIVCVISAILAGIVNIILLMRFIKKNKENEEPIPKKRKNKFNQDEYLNSYDFNVKLDGLIQPLLGKHSNNVIADLCIAKLYSVDKNLEYIDDNDVYDYIIKVLENYNNTYDSDNTSEEDIVEEKTEEVYYDPAREFSSNLNNKGTDITNTLKDFYK